MISWQYWLGITKPKSSNKYNSIMAKTTCLIFSLFDVASAQQVPFDILQYIQCTFHGFTCVLLCVTLSLLITQGVDLQKYRMMTFLYF